MSYMMRLLATASLLGTAAVAAETITYTYDVHGRLTQVLRGGGANDGLLATYELDRADNRQRLTVKDSTSPSFSVADVSAVEGANLDFVVKKSGTASGDIQISYSTANGTAVGGGTDFASQSGTLTFAAGEASKTVPIATKVDSLSEGTEAMKLNLANATGGATITDAQAISTLLDQGNNRSPTPRDDAYDVGACSGDNFLYVMNNDSDPEGNSIALHGTGAATRGTTATDGSRVRYTSPDFLPSQDDTFSYEIRDSSGARASASVRINFTNDCIPTGTQ